jgi:hypothetical protein
VRSSSTTVAASSRRSTSCSQWWWPAPATEHRPGVEGHQPDPIAAVERRLRHRRRGVDRPVERGLAARPAAHRRADVDAQHVGRDQLVVEVAHHQLAAARGGLPRDVLERVAVGVLAQLAQLAGQAAPAHPVLADLIAVAAAGHPQRRRHRGPATREHLDRDRVGEVGVDLEQPEQIAQHQHRAVEHLVAGGGRPHLGGVLDLVAGRHRRGDARRDLEAGVGQHLGPQHPQRPAAVVAIRDVQLERPIGRQRAAGLIAGRHPPRQLDLLAAEQHRGREERQVRGGQRDQHGAAHRHQRRRAAERADQHHQRGRRQHQLPAGGERRDHRRGVLYPTLASASVTTAAPVPPSSSASGVIRMRWASTSGASWRMSSGSA